MERFGRLEFDSPEPQRRDDAAAEQESRDEHYWLKRADEERREGHFENALRFYSRALELNKTLIPGWVGQVQMLIALEEYNEAELWARKALELFRNNPDLLAGRAHALLRMGQIAGALPISDAACAQEGQSAYRWMVRGEIMVARGQDVDRHCFDKATAFDPDWLVALEIGQIYRFRRRPAKAILRIRQAVERAVDRPYCWYVQGCCEMELGLYAAARKSFLQCLELKPGYLEARRQLEELDHERWSLMARIKRWLRRK